jgi:hypothetical protein
LFLNGVTLQGGFEYKRSIVETLVAIINEIPEAKACEQKKNPQSQGLLGADGLIRVLSDNVGFPLR